MNLCCNDDKHGLFHGVSQANLFNDPTDKPIAECLVQPVWEVLKPRLSSIAFSILVNTGQNEWLGGSVLADEWHKVPIEWR